MGRDASYINAAGIGSIFTEKGRKSHTVWYSGSAAQRSCSRDCVYTSRVADSCCWGQTKTYILFKNLSTALRQFSFFFRQKKKKLVAPKFGDFKR